MAMIDINNKEEILQKYKTNKMVKGGVIGVFLLMAYIFGGLNLIFAVAGLGLGYLAYNDHVEEVE
ncbi:MAG: hypothetical protein HQM13_00280 [SAR324 cluster bacterium]|nr:hypothetical protein [SAR324 cluster bacterium]